MGTRQFPGTEHILAECHNQAAYGHEQEQQSCYTSRFTYHRVQSYQAVIFFAMLFIDKAHA
jgi:hypothetical protein